MNSPEKSIGWCDFFLHPQKSNMSKMAPFFKFDLPAWKQGASFWVSSPFLFFRGVILEFASPSCFIPRFRWVSFQDVFLPVTDCKDVYLLEPWLQSLARLLGVSGSDVEGHDQHHQSVIQKHV